MKKIWASLVCFWGLALAGSAQAVQLEANVKYPVAMGSIAQGFTSSVGAGASLYFDPILDPAIPNFLSVGYQVYRIKADGTSALRMIPVIAGIEFPGKVFSDFNSTLAVGAGFAASYVNVTGITSYNWSMAFAFQIKPGFEYIASEDVSIVGHLPYSMFISRKLMNSMDFDLGIKIKL